MRFTEAWANVARENTLVKVVALVLAATTLTLGVVSAKLSLKTPIIIERACFPRVASLGTQAATAQEVESFIREAVTQRFDTNAAVQSEYFSLEELKTRDQEQAELKRREMKQRVTVEGVAKSGDFITVEADRILSVGTIRSAFAFPLKITIEPTTRTEGNPYGLVLTKVEPVESQKSEDKTNGK